MKQYAVIHAVAGLFEGYSDTTCEFFPKRELAEKHIGQILDGFRKDDMCVNIDHCEDDIYVTLTSEHEDYHACVPSDMEHDDWVADNGDDASVEVFRIIEIDCSRPLGWYSEHMWLTWDQLEATQAWDYTPLCMSLVARVASDVQEMNGDRDHHMDQLTDFISAVYYRDHAFIDCDDYVMHAFRIPKPKNSDSYDEA